MGIKIRCPVCDGIGKVPGNFGGGHFTYCDKKCPACEGTGMQEVSGDCYRRKYIPYTPYIPCTQPYQPWYTDNQPYWSITSGSSSNGLNLSQSNTYSVSSNQVCGSDSAHTSIG